MSTDDAFTLMERGIPARNFYRWRPYLAVGLNGRWVTFGGLTGADVKLNIQSLYSKQIRLIGSTGGNRKEFTELIDMSKEKTKVWKKFMLDEAKEALQAIFDKEGDGRILLNVIE